MLNEDAEYHHIALLIALIFDHLLQSVFHKQIED